MLYIVLMVVCAWLVLVWLWEFFIDTHRRRFHSLVIKPNDSKAEWDIGISPNHLSWSDLLVLEDDFRIRAEQIKSGARPSITALVEVQIDKERTPGCDKDQWQLIQEADVSDPTILPQTILRFPLRLRYKDLKRYRRAFTPAWHFKIRWRKDEAATAGGTELWSFAHGPALLCLFLSAMIEPAINILLMQPQCPINALASTNCRNAYDLLDPELGKDLVGSILRLSPATAELTVAFNPRHRLTEKGIEVDVNLSIWLPRAEMKGRGVEIFRQVHTIVEDVDWSRHISLAKMIELGQCSHSSPRALKAALSLTGNNVQQTAFTLGDCADWAGLCRDYHTPRSAGSRTACGSHVLAQAIQFVQQRFPTALYLANPVEKGPLRIEVKFHRQIPMRRHLIINEGPICVEFASHNQTPGQTKLNARRLYREEEQRLQYQVLDSDDGVVIHAVLSGIPAGG